MTSDKLAVVVLAAGQGTRFKSARPKVLHEVAGKSMLDHVLDAAATLAPERIVLVLGPGMEAVAEVSAEQCLVMLDDPAAAHNAPGADFTWLDIAGLDRTTQRRGLAIGRRLRSGLGNVLGS